MVIKINKEHFIQKVKYACHDLKLADKEIEIALDAIKEGEEEDKVIISLNFRSKNKKDFTEKVSKLMRKIGKIAFQIKINSMGERENMNINTMSMLSPHDLIEEDLLIEKIEPWIEEIRLRLFNTRKPPFKEDNWRDSLSTAIAWIKQKANEPLQEDIQKKVDRYYEEIKKLKDLIKKGEIIGTVASKAKLLDFPGLEGWIERVPVIGHRDLERLERYVSEINKATGFKKHAVTMYILTGLEPQFPRVEINNKSSTFAGGFSNYPINIQRASLTIEINSTEVTFEELKRIYMKYYRKENKKKKPLTKGDWLFYNLVKEEGKPPEKGKSKRGEWTRYWNKVGEKFFEEKNKHQAAYMKYKRILKKFETNKFLNFD